MTYHRINSATDNRRYCLKMIGLNHKRPHLRLSAAWNGLCAVPILCRSIRRILNLSK